VLCFPPEDGESEIYAWLPFFWIPAENMIERERKDRVPYSTWVRQGLITATEGNVIDYGFIVKKIEELGEVFQIKEIAFDRWGAFQVSQQLEGAGFTMAGFGQGFQSMAAPTKELLRLVQDGKLAHGGNPVLRWMADNLVVSTDPAGNVKPNKEKSREKIDGIVAGVMALDRAVRHGSDKSVYEGRGVLML
jgi:phage terminase large subunit-like protein